MSIRTVARVALSAALLAEAGMALHRFEIRRRTFDAAARRASALARPLVVVGDPDAGMHTSLKRAYGCGDMCIDKNGCPMCTVTKVADLTKGPIDGIADDSAVVFVSCVLEYVEDPEAALRELRRIAGSPDNLFLVFVEPWTITAALYPGAQWAGGPQDSAQGKIAMQPITRARKVAVAGSLGLLALAAARRR
ncbi:MAG: hypothetical protein JNL82_17555 [Myxococcales bacterium]|nr:hypothetical protein [Myxococcales bacterium]